MAEKSAQSLLTFLDQDDMVTVKDYFEPLYDPIWENTSLQRIVIFS